jgi:hypothetical protein
LEKPAIELPKLSIEAAFAASNTNIIVKGDHTWLVSGGLKSAYFTQIKERLGLLTTPIIQGKAMTGIFTADFMMLKMVLLLEEITMFLDKILVIKHVQLMVVKHGN